MASITDCVVEGLKYPFNDIKKLLGFGALFALMSVISTYMGFKSLQIFNTAVHLSELNNSTAPYVPLSQLPAGDIYLVIGLAIASIIVSLFILGYQYDIVKFSIEKKESLPGFDDIVGMFIRGVKYFLVVVAYNIIPNIVLIGGIMLIGDSSILPVLVLISAILFIIAYFLLIMALNNMVAYDAIKKAFDFEEIIGNIKNLGWGKYIGTVIFTIIIYIIIMVAASFILSFLAAIFTVTISNQALLISAIIALIEGLFVNSYAAIFYNRVCGSIYRESIK